MLTREVDRELGPDIVNEHVFRDEVPGAKVGRFRVLPVQAQARRIEPQRSMQSCESRNRICLQLRDHDLERVVADHLNAPADRVPRWGVDTWRW